jgi:hypothetical protein
MYTLAKRRVGFFHMYERKFLYVPRQGMRKAAEIFSWKFLSIFDPRGDGHERSRHCQGHFYLVVKFQKRKSLE